jgi:hypothetical protein
MIGIAGETEAYVIKDLGLTSKFITVPAKNAENHSHLHQTFAGCQAYRALLSTCTDQSGEIRKACRDLAFYMTKSARRSSSNNAMTERTNQHTLNKDDQD